MRYAPIEDEDDYDPAATPSPSSQLLETDDEKEDESSRDDGSRWVQLGARIGVEKQ
jgi:hypothetical protein